MAAGGGDITVTMTRLDGDREKVKLKLSKKTTVHAIKTRCEMEFGIPVIEQLLVFRGRPIFKDSFQPLSTPDLQDIIAEAGEDGLQMAVAFQERKLPAFLKREGLEDVNMKRSSGATLLHRAVRQCELNVVEELLALEEFSGVNARDRSGQTALHTAAECWQREAARLVLASDRFGTPATVDLEGRTALHLAAHWGDEEVCRQILGHKGFTVEDAHLLDSQGHSALEYATDCGHEAVVALITECCPPSAAPPEPTENQEAPPDVVPDSDVGPPGVASPQPAENQEAPPDEAPDSDAGPPGAGVPQPAEKKEAAADVVPETDAGAAASAPIPAEGGSEERPA